ncbi:O-antigen ligase family protein [Candidatus Uhrbacteria bacterium]|nr:O-antigen ligase family protein [Candidatus Uhrbacteria bacterium]
MTTAFFIILYSLFVYTAWTKFRFALGLLVFSLPSYLIRFHIGPFPTTFLEGLLLILFLIWGARTFLIERRTLREISSSISQSLSLSIFIPILLFLLASVISIFVAPDIRAALGLWRAYIIEPLLFFIILLDTATKKSPLLLGEGAGEVRLADIIIAALAASALFLSIIAIYQYFTGWMIPYPWQELPGRRVTSIFPYPNALGLYLAPIIVLLTGWSINTKNKLTAYCFALTAILSSAAILAAKSHGAIAGVIAGLFLIGVSQKKFRAFTVVVLILASVIIGAYSPWRSYVMSYLTFTTASGKIRITQYQETMTMLRDGRILQGAGLSGYKKTVKPYHKNKRVEIYPYPHNIMLNFWTELGLFGLLSFLWLIVAAYQCAIKKIKRLGFSVLNLGFPAVASLTTLLVHGLVDVPFFKNDLAILFWIIIALIILETTSVKHAESLRHVES